MNISFSFLSIQKMTNQWQLLFRKRLCNQRQLVLGYAITLFKSLMSFVSFTKTIVIKPKVSFLQLSLSGWQLGLLVWLQCLPYFFGMCLHCSPTYCMIFYHSCSDILIKILTVAYSCHHNQIISKTKMLLFRLFSLLRIMFWDLYQAHKYLFVWSFSLSILRW